MKQIDVVKSVVDTLKRVLPKDKELISLHEPTFQGNEWNYVKECIDTGWVSSVGKYVNQFEQMLVEYTGVKHAIAVVNGTAALHICLKLVGVQPNDEVLIPALTFIATANAVSYCGAIPHFVDSSNDTLGIDPFKLDYYLDEICERRKDGSYNKITGRRIKAMVPMHTFGHPVDLDALFDVCIRYQIEMVEDTAESLGSYYKGKHTGNWGKASALSFNGNKVVTTGGGGAILTNDEQLGKFAKHLTTTAKKPHRWTFEHDHVGYNYRMPNINAALGCAQIEKLPTYVQQKRALADIYKEAFRDMKGIQVIAEPVNAKSNYWLNAILLDEDRASLRDDILERTNEQGIMTRPVWRLLHNFPMFADSPKMDVSVAESLEARIINIPSSPFLGASYG
ncbi:perosamine synthetase [Brevibacillus reuszeri]|uniref:LegC family aminotransferase n=1 Tax=Brevibacillus reuszeri TaxID=54915 RepID=UPI001B004FC4|nr:LegC family aminotransferase [Brevibacillus reuszeri]GIO07339.1 perosamine synthetase [Brevibacillus reuszeri]